MPVRRARRGCGVSASSRRRRCCMVTWRHVARLPLQHQACNTSQCNPTARLDVPGDVVAGGCRLAFGVWWAARLGHGGGLAGAAHAGRLRHLACLITSPPLNDPAMTATRLFGERVRTSQMWNYQHQRAHASSSGLPRHQPGGTGRQVPGLSRPTVRRHRPQRTGTPARARRCCGVCRVAGHRPIPINITGPSTPPSGVSESSPSHTPGLGRAG